MNTTGESQMEEIPAVKADSFRPMIHSFLERMTSEQWRLLRSGTPDDATMVLLAELLLEFITSISNTVMMGLQSTHVVISEKNILASLGDTLRQSFAQVLQVQDEGRSVSSERLTKLIVKEVAESVNSALSARTNTEEPVLNQHVTLPCRLNGLVHQACKMLRDFMKKVKNLSTPRPRRPRSNWATDVEDLQMKNKKSEDLKLEDMESEDTDGRCVSPMRKEDTPEKDTSQDSFVIKTSKAVQDIIIKECHGITEPLLDKVEDSVYNLLQCESSLEIEIVGDDIANLLIEDAKSLHHSDTESPREDNKCNPCAKGVKRKVKTFFAKLFVKTLIHRVVAQLKSKYHRDSKGESKQSMQSLMSNVEFLLLTDVDKEGGNEVCVFQRLQTVSSGKMLVFTKALSDLIYMHIRNEIIPESIAEKLCNTVAIPQQHAVMYSDISSRVRCFLTLMNWWLRMQVGSHSSRVVLALMNSDVFSQRQLPGVAEQDASICEEQQALPARDSTKKEKNQTSVGILVEKLVYRLFRKAKLNVNGIPEALFERLFEKVWAEVEDVDFDLTPEALQNLDKAIFKDLCKNWGNAEMVLLLIKLENPLIEKYIATSFKAHVTPKKRSAIYRFFSSVGKALSKPFRWRI